MTQSEIREKLRNIIYRLNEIDCQHLYDNPDDLDQLEELRAECLLLKIDATTFDALEELMWECEGNDHDPEDTACVANSILRYCNEVAHAMDGEREIPHCEAFNLQDFTERHDVKIQKLTHNGVERGKSILGFRTQEDAADMEASLLNLGILNMHLPLEDETPSIIILSNRMIYNDTNIALQLMWFTNDSFNYTACIVRNRKTIEGSDQTVESATAVLIDKTDIKYYVPILIVDGMVYCIKDWHCFQYLVDIDKEAIATLHNEYGWYHALGKKRSILSDGIPCLQQ